MLIKNKIILGFVLLTGTLMVLFSVYIYVIYGQNREKNFYERLKGKIEFATEIYDKHDTLSEKVITSIPEQSEYIFDNQGRSIFQLNPANDYPFDEAFFHNLDSKEEYRFHYQTAPDQHSKEGLAISFMNKGVKRYAVITAFDQNNREMLSSLALILVYGNMILIFLIGIAGYLLAVVALKPLTRLVHEIEAIHPNNLNVQLAEHTTRNEVAIVAGSFNGLLDKINALVETQRSFIAYASHELRTPLAAISGILETSIKYDQDLESAQTSAALASGELNKAIGLTNELLLLSKIEGIDSQVKMMPVDLVELTLDLINTMNKRNPGQEFDLFISDGYALESNNITLNGNEELLKTAIGNIIDNGIKYSDGKKIFLRIEMNTDAEVRLTVIDTGIGIVQSDLNRIFLPMARGMNSTEKKGFGLGLTLTRKIIDLHKGRIEIKSKPGHGTEISLFLPVQTAV